MANQIRRLEDRMGAWAIARRWWVIVSTLLLVLGIASGVRYLTFNNDSRVFFSEKNPQLQALQALENTYTKEQNVVFVIAPKNGDVFTRETLTLVEELTTRCWQIPYANRVDSITNFQHTQADGDDLIIGDLVENAAQLSDADLARVKRNALSEPLLVNHQISPSGHVTSIIVNSIHPGETMAEVPEIDAYARGLARDMRDRYPNIDLYLTGTVPMDHAFGQAGLNDMTTLMPLMFAVLIIVIGLSLRTYLGTLITFIIIGISMVTGMGLAGWLGISLTPASVNAPLFILCLAVANSVHILATTFQQMRLGKTKRQAIGESLRINFQPVFITSLTTVIGFVSMNFSDAPPFRDLGNIVAMGITAAFVFSILFLPALVAVLPVAINPTTRDKATPCCGWVASFVVKRRALVLWGTLLAGTVLAMGVSRIELNDVFVKYFSEDYEIRIATDFFSDNLTGTDAIEYSLRSGEPGGINDPAYLAKVEEFANWYREQPKVVHVSAITDIMKRLNKNMHADDETYFRIPAARDLAAQYLLLYEMSLPFGLDLNNMVNVDKSETRMAVRLRNTNTSEQRALEERGRAWLGANAPESMFTFGSGLSIIWAHISERNINAMMKASFGALVLISGILIFALKSVRLGLLSIATNIAPVIMAFGVWGLFVGQVGLGLSVIAAMTLGIVVDDTVHFMSKYLRARREHGMGPVEAVHYAFDTVGTAMWVTTLALVAGFLVLTFSGYNMSADMGVMAALTISLALALDFFSLPALLLSIEK